jgi:hypothetical protein
VIATRAAYNGITLTRPYAKTSSGYHPKRKLPLKAKTKIAASREVKSKIKLEVNCACPNRISTHSLKKKRGRITKKRNPYTSKAKKERLASPIKKKNLAIKIEEPGKPIVTRRVNNNTKPRIGALSTNP